MVGLMLIRLHSNVCEREITGALTFHNHSKSKEKPDMGRLFAVVEMHRVSVVN